MKSRDEILLELATAYRDRSAAMMNLDELLSLRISVIDVLREDGIDPKSFPEYYRVHFVN